MTATPKKHVYIAMPTFTGKPRIETHFCMLNAQEGLRRMGWDSNWKYTVRDSMIFRTRNLFAADFYYNKQYTDLVMIDDDLWWEEDALLRLLSHDVDVVAGAYPKRQEKLEFPIKCLPNATAPDGNGLLEVDKVPTGFFRISRACIEKMVAHYGEKLAYRENILPQGKAWALFWFDLVYSMECGMNELMGEDFTFCQRWRDIGGSVYVDTLLRFKHYGEKAFEGCLAEHIPGYIDALQASRQAARAEAAE